MSLIIAFNDVLPGTATREALVTGTATATPIAGEGIANAATRPPRRAAAWTLAGGASGGTVRIRLTTSTSSRPLRAVAVCSLEIPAAGVTQLLARTLLDAATVEAAAALASADFSRPFDASRRPWDVLWEFAGGTANGAELELTLAAGAAGTLRIGRLWASEALVLDDGCDADWQEVHDDASIVNYPPARRTPSVYKGDKFRRLRLPVSAVSEDIVLGVAGSADQVLSDFQAWADWVGRGDDLVVSPRTSTAHYRQRLPLYCTLDAPITFSRDASGEEVRFNLEVAQTR